MSSPPETVEPPARRGWSTRSKVTFPEPKRQDNTIDSTRSQSHAYLPNMIDLSRFQRSYKQLIDKSTTQTYLRSKANNFIYHTSRLLSLNEVEDMGDLEDEEPYFALGDPHEPLPLILVRVAWDGMKERQLATNQILSDEVYSKFCDDHLAPQAVYDLHDPELQEECFDIFNTMARELAAARIAPASRKFSCAGSLHEKSAEEVEAARKIALDGARARAFYFTDYRSQSGPTTAVQEAMSEYGDKFTEAHRKMNDIYSRHCVPPVEDEHQAATTNRNST